LRIVDVVRPFSSHRQDYTRLPSWIGWTAEGGVPSDPIYDSNNVTCSVIGVGRICGTDLLLRLTPVPSADVSGREARRLVGITMRISES